MEVQNRGRDQGQIGLVGESYRWGSHERPALHEHETEQRQPFIAIQKLVKDVSSSEEEIRHLYEGIERV